MIESIIAFALAASPNLAPAAHDVPVLFRHDRIFVETHAPDGSALEFFTDSGGGWNAIAASVAKRLGLAVIGRARNNDDGSDLPLVAFPAFVESAGVPRPVPESWLHGGLAVAPDSELETQGTLGSRWFAGHIWEFDYSAHTLRLLDHHAKQPDEHRVALGFKTKADGSRAMNFPRVTISVDGEAIDMLLDTGATARLTAASATKFGLPAGTRIATSFITRSHFEAWQRRHPDWPVVEGGETQGEHVSAMIEVPHVTIAGVTSGPVWFTQRADTNYHWMSQMTDRPVDGSLGGSALRYYRVVVDYPEAEAWFRPVALRGQ